MEVQLPASFPEHYRTAIVRAAEGCKVKKTIAAAPVTEIIAVPSGALSGEVAGARCA
jgi:hypothetical protein